MKFHQCEKKVSIKLKSLKFIVPRGIQDSFKREFIKKGKDSLSIEMCKHIEARKMYRKCIKMTYVEENKGGKRSPKSSFN